MVPCQNEVNSRKGFETISWIIQRYDLCNRQNEVNSRKGFETLPRHTYTWPDLHLSERSEFPKGV